MAKWKFYLIMAVVYCVLAWIAVTMAYNLPIQQDWVKAEATIGALAFAVFSTLGIGYWITTKVKIKS